MTVNLLTNFTRVFVVLIALHLIVGADIQSAELSSQNNITEAPREPADAAPVDIAAFARVVTSDPQRMKGTSAGRVDEIPAGDVFLETDVLPASDGSYTVPATADGTRC